MVNQIVLPQGNNGLGLNLFILPKEELLSAF